MQPADERLPQDQRPYRQMHSRARPAHLTAPHDGPSAPPERQAHHEVAQGRLEAELAHRTRDGIIVGDPAIEAAPIADPLQGLARDQGHASGGDGDAQPVGRKEEARLLPVDIGALQFGGEIPRRLPCLERQHQADRIRQRQGGAAQVLGIEQDARVAQRHERTARRLETLAHVVHLGIEGRVVADEDRRLGPCRPYRRERFIVLGGNADQDLRAGVRQRPEGMHVGRRCVAGAAHRRDDREVGRRMVDSGEAVGRRLALPRQYGGRPVQRRACGPPAEACPRHGVQCHPSLLAGREAVDVVLFHQQCAMIVADHRARIALLADAAFLDPDRPRAQPAHLGHRMGNE